MTTARKNKPRGLAHHVRGRRPEEVQKLFLAAIKGMGRGRWRWSDLRDHFLRGGMTGSDAEQFAGELAYGPYSEKLEHGWYKWAPGAERLARHRAWRFPRGQLDLASALLLLRGLADLEGAPPMLQSMLKRLRQAVSRAK